MDIYYRHDTKKLCDSLGAEIYNANFYPRFPVQATIAIDWYFLQLNTSTNLIEAADVSSVYSWTFSLDDDFSSATNVMARATNTDIIATDAVNGHLVITLNTNTVKFASVTDGHDTVTCYGQLKASNISAEKIEAYKFQIVADGDLDLSVDPPTENVTLYYTKAEVDDRLTPNESHDITILDDATATIILFDKTDVLSGVIDITLDDTVSKNRIIALIMVESDGSIIPEVEWLYNNAEQISLSFTFDISGDNVRMNITNTSGNTISATYQTFDYTNTRASIQDLIGMGLIFNDGTDLTSGKIPVATTNGRLTDVTPQTELTDELTTITYTSPGTPDYALQDLVQNTGFGFVTKDEGNTVLSVIANLQTRVKELEDKLVALGLLADAD